MNSPDKSSFIALAAGLMLALSFPLFSQSGDILSLRIFPENAAVSVDGSVPAAIDQVDYFIRYRIPSDSRFLEISAEGYIPRSIDLRTVAEGRLEIKLERQPGLSIPRLINILESGSQPKSIEFSPDGKYIFVAQLNGTGIDVYDARTLSHIREIRLSHQGENTKGYVEFAVNEETGQLWISRMTTGSIFVLDLSTLELKAEFSSHGSWTKVIGFSPDGLIAYISNWLSGDVTVFRASDFSYLGRIPVGAIPRGLAVSPEGDRLFVADYEKGQLLQYNISVVRDAASGTLEDLQTAVKSVSAPRVLIAGPGAKRHIVISRRLRRIYVSDMYWGRIYVFDLDSGALLASPYVGQKLNTIALDPQERYLYISSRGRNNPKTYLIPGPDFGKVFILDAEDYHIVDWIWGGNQPTGLAVSPDGNVLAFSDFLDHRVEFYDVSELSAVNPLNEVMGRLQRVILAGLDRVDEFPAPVKLVEEEAETGAARRE